MDMDAVAIGHGLGVNDAVSVLRVSVCISHHRIMDMDEVAIGHGLGVHDALRVLRVSVCLYLTTG